MVAVEGAFALEQTAFFPGGGGQMADRGTLTIAGRRILITALRKSGDVVCSEQLGEPRCAQRWARRSARALDWDFRYQMMRTHTALHSLTAVIFRDMARR